MDVRCARCGTEYDFDDALVSERGTTVKCTNCAHQFKVYPGGGGGVPERWIVRKSSGRELVYTSLRDLQRAIAQRQVGPTDLLSRGGAQPMRQLGAIAELEPFFTTHGPTPAPAVAEPTARTLLGMSPGTHHEDTIPEQPHFDEPSAPTGRAPAHTPAGGFSPPRQGAPAPQAHAAQYARQEDIEPKTVPRNQTPSMDAPPPTLGSTLSSAGVPRAQLTSNAGNGQDPMAAAFRSPQQSFSDEPLPHVPTQRSSALRWIVGLVVVGGLAFVGATVGLRYVKKGSQAETPAAPAKDDRVQKLLSQGDTDLSRGDFESAKEQYDKASALAERDPAVLSALARLEAARADVHWLMLKLTDPSNATELDGEKGELDGRLARVRRAADVAASVAPNDPAVLRARIDALRLGGDLSKARELVGGLAAFASDPETAYVLAALDMAEAAPAWSTVIDRLRTAASTERGLGRARAALVYALASSNSADEARAELSKLEASGAPSRLLASLRAYLKRAAAGAAGASAEPPSSAAPAVSGAPPASAAPATSGAPSTASRGAGDETAVPRGMDFRKLLEDASAAKRSGDLARAEALYRAAQEQQPGNIEALAGLGDVARARGDTSAAEGYYEAVLQQNPTYLPSLVAAADIKWQRGDRAGALSLYKRVANQADPGSPYGQKAAQRIAEAQGSSGGAAAPAREAPAPTPAPQPQQPKPPSDSPANIDTSDLPGFK